MSDTWTRNELGFIGNGHEFFHQRDIRGIAKKDDDAINVYFFARVLTIKWSDAKDRDPMFEWFKKILEDSEKDAIEHSKRHHLMQEAQLEIQNQMAGKFINGGGCNH